MDDPLLVLRGERVALGPLGPDLAPAFARWRADMAVRQGSADLRVEGEDSVAAFLAARAEESARKGTDSVHFAVYDTEDLAPIGWTLLFGIDPRHHTATFGIALGERRGRGLGREATRLTLDWAFFVLGLRNVLLETAGWNEAGYRAYRAAGFREIGRRRGATREWGATWDLVLMDAVPEDFDSPVLGDRAPRPS